ncbi:MAG: tRNA (adenosine(37)-N6)-threonylcarbamoyltransferase complex dimerization subunit type 1 TsaB [Anaerolineae bacterium]
MTTPLLLALDTCTDLASIALYDGEQVLSEMTWHSNRRHTVELLPQVVAMLTQAGLTAADVRGVAVAIGPGSFTGTRVALALAKGMATANDLPLFGIATLDAIAYAHHAQAWPVTALVQAGRGRVCWGHYIQAARPGAWQQVSPFAISSIEAVSAAIHAPTLFAGDLLASTRAVLTAQLGAHAHFASPALTVRRASLLAELAWPRFLAGATDDITTLAPIYLHDLPAGPGA